MARGIFVTLEGPEGSGKSTQIALIQQWLSDQGVETVTTREPGGTPTGEMIRNILQHNHSGESIGDVAEVLLFAASRAQHVDAVIRPALERGAWVLCDRYIDSTTAYQGAARGLDVEAVEQINRFAIMGVRPDITLLLDIDVDTTLARMNTRQEGTDTGPDRIENESRAFHERVREGYLHIAEREPDRVKKVDADGTPDAVFSQLRVLLNPWLKRHSEWNG